MKRTVILILVITAVLGFSTSCKKSSGVDDNQPPTIGVSVGNIAANFTENDSGGISFTLENSRGNVILLNFSAMWCAPCIAEAPGLVQLYNTYKERGLEIIQCIYQDEDGNPADAGDLARWIGSFGIAYLVIEDPDRSTVSTYRIGAIPTNIIIDRDFIIRYRAEGFSESDVRRWIENLL